MKKQILAIAAACLALLAVSCKQDVPVDTLTVSSEKTINAKWQGATADIVFTTNADRLIGEIGVMNSDLSQPEDVGQAKVLGGIWSAKTNDPPLKKGDKVKVLAIEGVKLIVEKTE